VIFADNTSKASVKLIFLPVYKLPTKIGFDDVRNSDPRFSCLCPFNLCLRISGSNGTF
jgi:hypothetical protein